jgi:Flp pilus assembly protein TadD
MILARPFLAFVTVLAFLAACHPRESVTDAAPVIRAMNLGVARMNQYNYDGAVQAFEEALRLDPSLVDARVNLAIALFNRGRRTDLDLDRAQQLLASVLEQQPDHLRALYFLAIAEQHHGHAAVAIPLLESVLAQRPKDGAAWYLLGLCRQRLGQPAEAELLKAVQFRPNLVSAYYRLWQLASEAGDTDRAQSYLARFKSLRESPLGESIELPQYNSMGELAQVEPFPSQPSSLTRARYQAGPWKRIATASASTSSPVPVVLAHSAHPSAAPSSFPAAAVAADLNGDGYLDLVLAQSDRDGSFGISLLLGQPDRSWHDATAPSGLALAKPIQSIAVGDLDNDGNLDLLLLTEHQADVYQGAGDGTFSPWISLQPPDTRPTLLRSALLLDADHDGDLDVILVGQDRLWLCNNNADRTFTLEPLAPTSAQANLDLVLAGDVDLDRDLDLIALGRPAQLWLNDLLGAYRPAHFAAEPIHANLGGVLQDLNGDGWLDLLTLDSASAQPALHLGDGHGTFQLDEAFSAVAEAARSWGEIRALRVADIDLDGDLDVVLVADHGHLLLNDGRGRFVLCPQVWSFPAPPDGVVELLDVNGDMVADLLCRFTVENSTRWFVAAGQLTPPSTALALAPTGLRGRDGRTRSPASGTGTLITVRAGLNEQTVLYTGVNGSPNQSHMACVFGLNGAPVADYVRLLWTDGVMQVETDLLSGQVHPIAELQRKISSCPVLFAWNGSRMKFITDFAGVGGLGYFVGPGECGQPQVLEHIKIEPDQLEPRNGIYDLRITEPMEETAYIDRLELQAVDHPAHWRVFPDERASALHPPSHDLLVLPTVIEPVTATNRHGDDCTELVQHTDRRYAHQPALDRRFIGFCEPHTLLLDFGRQLAHIQPDDRLFLFISGCIEYPYSQTVYAASQANIFWQAISVERRHADGPWETLIAEGGWPGGMGRTFTLDLTGHTWGDAAQLRLTTNLEIYYDQVYIAQDIGAANVQIRTVPLQRAHLQRLGFPLEYSPDGRLPTLYDYDFIEASATFHTLKGAYTRYGPVEELIREFDDQYVLVGPGDEIALEFDATALPAIPPHHVRSFILVSHAYCKDMDLYTATPQTLEPLPFRSMSRYPYPPTERYPESAPHQAYLRTYNTRIVQ